MAADNERTDGLTLLRPVDLDRDHARGGGAGDGVVMLVLYGDYLCPYCRRLRFVLAQVRAALGESLVYVFRHLPNEAVHPGADLLARATEAAAAQGRFWEMHDWLYEQEPPFPSERVFEFARSLGMDMDRFRRDLDSEATRARVQEDLSEGRSNGITVTPTFFIDGIRYDDAWDFHSLLEALQRPLAAQVKRTARVFANLPASAGFTLLLAAVAALVCANTPLAPYYHWLMDSSFSIGPTSSGVSMTVAAWFSEGLLAAFFLLVGLEIRREVTAGALTDPKAAVLPVVAAVGGVLAPAAIYLALATPATAKGWSVPTATDVAFTIGILALLGDRVPGALRVFVAALAVVDDILSMLTLAIFYPHTFNAAWLLGAAVAAALLFALNRARVYAGWPYAVVACALWAMLHAAGVHAALAGVILAVFLPTRPAPAAAPLLAQAATALAALESAERDARKAGPAAHAQQQELIRESASRNLSAASARLLSPAERIERAVAPWSAYFILPLFAFSATGISLSVNLQSAEDVRVLAGVVLGLVLGKPLGVLLASWLTIKARIGIAPPGTSLRLFVGAACLCGVGDTVALLMADQAFPLGNFAGVAKIGVLAGSALAAALGAAIVAGARPGAKVPV
ncbi:MAG TPA: Na+/H+ antiporter NhaA [Rudaea sp.]|nr:Na+/H+ antiporter NhaA [Rudaea sp.]HSC10787.1 Na+/H+ antiporter NhaA [Rhodanobacteraceae bacterium]